MKGEHTPPFPASTGDVIALILDSAKAKAWLDKAGKVIVRNNKILATIGKVDEIDKLHAEATEQKEVVLAAIEKREKVLVAERESFDAEVRKRRATMQKQEHDAGGRATADRNEVTRLLSDARQKDEAATVALRDAKKAQDQAVRERDAAKALREELAARRETVKQLARAVE